MPPALRELRVGTVVGGKYRIDAILGRGAMGVVAECQHLELRERVALKFLLTNGNMGSEDFRARFLREAQVSARLKNEHITRVVDVGVWCDSVPYMVMEHLDGLDLRAAIRRAGRLSPARAVDYAVQICEGIAEAHALGIVHRDLKPSNVFVTARADRSDLIKIIDFGISKCQADDPEAGEATATGVILGSPKYMSPEQMFAATPVDSRADVWSIGAIVYEMLTGRPPFESLSFAQLCEQLLTDGPPQSICAQVPEIPPILEDTVFRCLRRPLDRRIPNVAELAGALLDAIGSLRAESVRVKIETILSARQKEPRGSPDGAAVAERVSGRFATGTLDAVPPVAVVAPSANEAHGSSALRPVLLDAQRARRGLWLAMGLGLVSAGGVALASLGTSPRSAEAHAAPVHDEGPASALPRALPPASRPAAATPVEEQPGVAPPAGAPHAAEAPPVDAVGTASVDGANRNRPANRAHPTGRPTATLSLAGGPAPASPMTTDVAKTTNSRNTNCDPPFVLSSDGVRSYKPECF